MSDYRTIFETLLPDGSVWKPKYKEFVQEVVELITNGTFDSDISGWTIVDDVTWDSGEMRLAMGSS